MVTGLLCLQGVLHGLGRVDIRHARLLDGGRSLLLSNDCATAALHEHGACEGGVRIEWEVPGGRLPDAAELLELLLDGKGLAGDDEVLSGGRKEKREHLV